MDVDFTRLIQMCRFDCAHTLYKFCGQVNCRKFGVPMGGFTSPGLAILCCAMVEMELGPEGLIGTVVRFQGSGLRRGVGSTGKISLFFLAGSYGPGLKT